VWTVDIDVGGTLTDGLFTGGDRVACVKVDTTPHDLTVCLFDCLTQGAAQLNFPDTAAFLENVELIRWSTTITSNVLAELRGPRIGMLVSQGHEKNLYGNGTQETVLNKLLAGRDVIGMKADAADAAIMNAARVLLERGVRRICISLQGANRQPERELAWKRIIDQQYPDHFLGSVPVLAGSDISKSADDRTRASCAAINAYTHGALAATLFKAEDDLREASHYEGTFLVSHINGGVAGIAKTRAIDTLESGPVLGILGSAYLAKTYGLKDVIAMTSAARRRRSACSRPASRFIASRPICLAFLSSFRFLICARLRSAAAASSNHPRVRKARPCSSARKAWDRIQGRHATVWAATRRRSRMRLSPLG
jgi:N-methylhydantoinase A